MKLCTCLANSREEHMIIQPDESDELEEEEGDSSGSDDDSDSGSEHDSGEDKAGGGGSEPEGAAEANGQDAEGRGSHGGDERHTHKDGKKVGGIGFLADTYCGCPNSQHASLLVCNTASSPTSLLHSDAGVATQWVG